MSLQFKVYGLMALAFGGFVSADMYDRETNYTKVEARIADLEIDCSVEARKSKLTKKDTGELAYMPCEMAPVAAAMHGFASSDIRKRARIEYSYVSPVDGNTYSRKYTDSNFNEGGQVAVGATVEVYAHTSEPKKARWH